MGSPLFPACVRVPKRRRRPRPGAGREIRLCPVRYARLIFGIFRHAPVRTLQHPGSNGPWGSCPGSPYSNHPAPQGEAGRSRPDFGQNRMYLPKEKQTGSRATGTVGTFVWNRPNTYPDKAEGVPFFPTGKTAPLLSYAVRPPRKAPVPDEHPGGSAAVRFQTGGTSYADGGSGTTA